MLLDAEMPDVRIVAALGLAQAVMQMAATVPAAEGATAAAWIVIVPETLCPLSCQLGAWWQQMVERLQHLGCRRWMQESKCLAHHQALHGKLIMQAVVAAAAAVLPAGEPMESFLLPAVEVMMMLTMVVGGRLVAAVGNLPLRKALIKNARMWQVLRRAAGRKREAAGLEPA